MQWRHSTASCRVPVSIGAPVDPELATDGARGGAGAGLVPGAVPIRPLRNEEHPVRCTIGVRLERNREPAGAGFGLSNVHNAHNVHVSSKIVDLFSTGLQPTRRDRSLAFLVLKLSH